MISRSLAVVGLLALLVPTAAVAQAAPSGMEAVPESHRENLRAYLDTVRSCLDSDAADRCLGDHVVDRINFPHLQDLAHVSDVCGRIHRTARERGGRGWHVTGPEFASCILDAPHPSYRGGESARSLREHLASCFRTPPPVLQASRDGDVGHATLAGPLYLCYLVYRDRWRLDDFLQRP